MPKKIGVVTSKSGAALRDIINVLSRRYPIGELYIVNALVQGEAAPDSVCRGILKAESAGCDVVIVGRGGGSIEDLGAFNTEKVAYAVYNCKVPVISAVGHETDVTLLDLAADVRASTPTQAAEIAVPDKKYIEERIICLYLVLQKIIRDKLNISKLKLQHTLTIFNILAQRGKVTAVRKDILYNWIILDRKLEKVISNKKLDILCKASAHHIIPINFIY